MLGFAGNPLETQVYSDCRIFLRSSDPVIISGANGCKTSKFLGCRWLKCARHRPSSLSKELLQPFGRDDEDNRRLSGDIAPSMPGASRYMDVITHFRYEPLRALYVLLQSLHLARDDDKVLCIRMTVKRNNNARRDAPLQDAKVILCFFRGRQKLHRWSEDVECQASRRILLSTYLFPPFSVHKESRHLLGRASKMMTVKQVQAQGSSLPLALS